ncbi:STAS domain-containing protein [Kitasatospora sp. NPDC101157]|uniref:STAS domain-containing protein n=1 Tax=Kitasatospora sp. NPDC101157 TaxID=3364098 RepID=UPI003825980F
MPTTLTTRRCPAPAGTRVLALAGQADLDTAPVLAAALDGALTDPPLPRTLVIDCSALGFCSSSGLNELLRARLAAVGAGIAFRLAAPGFQMARLLDITDTDTVFDILPARPLPCADEADLAEGRA